MAQDFELTLDSDVACQSIERLNFKEMKGIYCLIWDSLVCGWVCVGRMWELGCVFVSSTKRRGMWVQGCVGVVCANIKGVHVTGAKSILCYH